jgi:hypothetical protein
MRAVNGPLRETDNPAEKRGAGRTETDYCRVRPSPFFIRVSVSRPLTVLARCPRLRGRTRALTDRAPTVAFGVFEDAVSERSYFGLRLIFAAKLST